MKRTDDNWKENIEKLIAHEIKSKKGESQENANVGN